MTQPLTINHRAYTPRGVPVVGICMDGTSMDYYEAAAGVMPHLQRILEQGSAGIVRGILPSFTNPNNMGIVTGVPPVVNGICGNYYYCTERDEEVSMNTPEDLKCPTIPAAFSQAGKSVAIVTAKDKLCRMLRKDLNGICFSGEFADRAEPETAGIGNVTTDLMGRPQPGIYDPDLSVYVIEAGVRLLSTRSLDLVYLTTTDFVQHKYAPGHPVANEFLRKIDEQFGALDRMGVILGITADHGMRDKTNADGTPKVLFAESILGDAGIPSRVILPIADPYTVHHGSLGGYGTIHVAENDVPRAIDILKALPGIESVLTRDEAAALYQLPPEKLGELVVLADADSVIGRYPEWHELDKVKEGLRSHGCLHEVEVPLIVNRPLKPEYADKLASGEARNFDLFDFLHNGALDA